jgi:hypothetical protein
MNADEHNTRMLADLVQRLARLERLLSFARGNIEALTGLMDRHYAKLERVERLAVATTRFASVPWTAGACSHEMDAALAVVDQAQAQAKAE